MLQDPHRRLDARPAAALLALLAAPLAFTGDDPTWYHASDDWRESLTRSLVSLTETVPEDRFVPVATDVRRGGADPLRVACELHGSPELYLVAEGVPDARWGVANWAAARLVRRDGRSIPLSSVKGLTVLRGRHRFDMTLRSGLEQPMAMAGVPFDRGLHVEADSTVLLPLEGDVVRFEAAVGVDDWAGESGHVRFRILGSRSGARWRLWELLERDHTAAEIRRVLRREREDGVWRDWKGPEDAQRLAIAYAGATRRVPPLAAQASSIARSSPPAEAVARLRRLYHRSRDIDDAIRRAREIDAVALRLAIVDLVETFGGRYPRGAEYLREFDRRRAELEAALPDPRTATLEDWTRAARRARELEALRREALLANPLLDFDRLLVVRRRPKGGARRAQGRDRGLGEFIGLPRQSSWGNSTIPDAMRWDNELAVISPPRPDGRITRLWRPDGSRLLSDVDLDFDARRLIFSMPDTEARWQVHELDLETGRCRQVTPGDQPEVHSYDACYLPDGRIMFVSTAPLQGVPCNASVVVGMLYRMERDGTGIRQICFEQDHDYCPSVLHDGRVLYLRWDYTDTPHVWNRLLMGMNPDGTGQMEYYGSNSYWPNAIFHARAIPGHPTRVAGIVTGHHLGRIGELVVFDPARGRHETEGVVQRVPGRGERVRALIEDKLTEHSWPKMVHPWPLDEKRFIVAAKPAPDALWGIWLVDVFDNMILLHEDDEHALLEPIPLRPRPTPPVIPDRVAPRGNDALLHLVDVYAGRAMEGVPRGTVKALRLFTYHFGYQRMAGIDHRVGADGPWEVKRVLGTVPVEPDGSALARVPARTPISVQPLDEDGRAVALMRSWMTAMPGETLSCVGCHESQDTSPPNVRTLAFERGPSTIRPWYGPPRGFSFRSEVQPVLDRHCVDCHDGSPDASGRSKPDLRGGRDRWVVYEHGKPGTRLIEGEDRHVLKRRFAGVFDPSYAALRKLVRVGGLESDLHVLPPLEFHASTSELIQMLEKGHHGVRLDDEAWDRLQTWIDLNAPCHGTWSDVRPIPGDQRRRRLELRRLYGGLPEDPEADAAPDPTATAAAATTAATEGTSRATGSEPVRETPPRTPVTLAGWPFDASEARRRQAAAGPTELSLDLGGGESIRLRRIPAGSFVMGDDSAGADEQPRRIVEIESSFWMSACEVTNAQYARFDPEHRSRFEHRTSWIFDEAYLGWPLDRPGQPVVRVSWERAVEFTRWLSRRTGRQVSLPTEEEWEYACRAGTDSSLWHGGVDADFSKCANLADASLRRLADEGWRPRSPDLVAREDRFDDGHLVTAEVGAYLPNAWGLHDMHGNVGEWTLSAYRGARRVARGGSWRARPPQAGSARRIGYAPWQRVHDVGFRIVVADAPEAIAAARGSDAGVGPAGR